MAKSDVWRPHPSPATQPGDRLFIPCEGGPGISRLVTFPPPLELPERGGMYVLDDHGEQMQWKYVFIADGV